MMAAGSGRYDPAQDRFDVAMRAVLWLVSQGKWPLLGRMTGLTRKEHHARIAQADLDTAHLKGDVRLWAILAECPFLIVASIEVQATYQQATSASRTAYYQEREGDNEDGEGADQDG